MSDVGPRQAGAGPSRLLGAAIVGALSVAALYPQGRIEAGPVICPFRLLTGLSCPVCGLTRSWVHLAHGDLGGSFAAHPIGPLTLLLAVVTLGWIVRTRAQASAPGWLRRGALGVALLTAVVGAGRLVAELA